MARGMLSLDLFRNHCSVILGQQVALVEHDEIGAKQLIVIDLIKRVFVIDGGIGGALRCDFCSGRRQSDPP